MGFAVSVPAAATAVPVSGIDKLGFEAFDVTVTVPVNVPVDVGANFTVKVVLCPDVNVTGGVIPEMLNPVPDAPTAEIVALAPPVFLIVSVWLELCPTVMFVKVKLVGDAVSTAAAATAVPVKGIAKLGFEASDVTVTVPLNVPAEVGANFTVNVVLCPAVSVTGGVIPETLNPVPDAATAEIVRLEPPVFVMVSVWLEFCPTVIFVNVKLVGDADATAGVAPVPDNAISAVLLDPLKLSETCPLTAPPAVGANFTPNVLSCPGANVKGRLNPVTLKPAPVTVACEIVRLAPPVFCRVSVCVALLPTATVPKLKLLGLVDNTPDTIPVPASGTFRTLLAPVFVSARLPVTLPTACGWKTILKLVVCPAVRVIGKLNPLIVKLGEFTLAAVMSRLVPPVLVRVLASVWLVPTPTLPNAMFAGVALS